MTSLTKIIATAGIVGCFGLVGCGERKSFVSKWKLTSTTSVSKWKPI